MSTYLPSLSENIIQILKDYFGVGYGIQMYFNGDPMVIPKNYLPAICVEKISSKATQASTQRDDLHSVVVIKLIFNKEDDYNQSDSEDSTLKKMERMVEGRDDVTRQYLSNSLLGVLRQYFTMGNRITLQEEEVDYGISMRPDQSVTAECHIKLNIEERIVMNAPRT